MATQPLWRELRTLSNGARSRVFEWRDEGDLLAVRMPSNVTKRLARSGLDLCLQHFANRGWFQLGASMTDPTPEGLGDYFRTHLRASPRYASHFAAILVHLKLLEARQEGTAIVLRVTGRA